MARGKGGRGSGWLLWIGVAALIVLADQFSKVLVMGSFVLGESLPVTGFFNLVRVHNAGAAFSFLSDAGGWQRWFFTGLGVVAAAIMVWMYWTSLTILIGAQVGRATRDVLIDNRAREMVEGDL